MTFLRPSAANRRHGSIGAARRDQMRQAAVRGLLGRQGRFDKGEYGVVGDATVRPHHAEQVDIVGLGREEARLQLAICRYP